MTHCLGKLCNLLPLSFLFMYNEGNSHQTGSWVGLNISMYMKCLGHTKLQDHLFSPSFLSPLGDVGRPAGRTLEPCPSLVWDFICNREHSFPLLIVPREGGLKCKGDRAESLIWPRLNHLSALMENI